MSGVREATAEEVRANAGLKVCWRFAVNESPDPWTEGVLVIDRTIAGDYGISYQHSEEGLFPHTRVMDEVASRVERGTLVVTFDDPKLVLEIEEEERIEASTRKPFWLVESGYGVTIDLKGLALCDVCGESCEDAGEAEALYHVEAHRRHDPDGGPDVGFPGYGWSEPEPADHDAAVPAEGSPEWEQGALDVALESLSASSKRLAEAERAVEDARREERDAAWLAGYEIARGWARLVFPTCGRVRFEMSVDEAGEIVAPERRVLEERERAGAFVAKYGFVSACSECA